jgi:predicted DNA-binding protein YlxM (UPF0122 family)
MGFSFKVVRGAGIKSGFSDEAYEKAGASLIDKEEQGYDSEIILRILKPQSADGLKKDTLHLSYLDPFNEKALLKEFAEKANVSVQAVYQRLDRDLKPYLKTFKGKKCLSVEGLRLFIKEDSRAFKASLNKSPLNCFKEDGEKADIATIEMFKDTLKSLQEQLAVKDDQIRERDKQISDLTAMLQEEREERKQLTTALTAAQALHAGTIQQQLGHHEPDPDLQAQEEQPAKEPAEDPSKKKLSFFQRLFKRDV